MKSDSLSPLPPLLPVLPYDGRAPRPHSGEQGLPPPAGGRDPLVEIAAPPAIAEQGGMDATLAKLGSQAAMRVDQLVLGRVAWQAPDALMLAHAMSSSARQQGRIADDAAHALAAAVLHGAAVARDASAPPAVRPDPHFLPVYAWGGAPLLLALAVAEDAQSPWRRKRQRAASLRLELTPPLLGRLMLEVHWVVGGLELSIAVEQPESMPQLRAALPAVLNALRHAGLALLRFNLSQGAAAIARLHNGNAGSFPGHAQWQSLLQLPGEMQGLFRALAETAVALMGWVPATPEAPASGGVAGP